ncbi:MAG TPA: zinc-dependent peptidase [Gemmatimonadaceae bacterium]
MALFTGWRRTRLRALPLPAEWERMIERNVPAFGRLSPADQRELLGHTHVLLDEKTFEGCGGLALTDEIRVTVAAHASVLLLHRDTDYFARLKSILVYPSAYVVSGERHVGDGIWEDDEKVRRGETSQRLAAVVVGLDAVPGGSRNVAVGENVVLHEFAHQLDYENGFDRRQRRNRDSAVWREKPGRIFRGDDGAVLRGRGEASRQTPVAVRTVPRLLSPGPGELALSAEEQSCMIARP